MTFTWTQGDSIRRSLLLRLLVLTTAAVGVLALAGSALASDVYIDQQRFGDQYAGSVLYRESSWPAPAEANDVTVSVSEHGTLEIEDRGAAIWWPGSQLYPCGQILCAKVYSCSAQGTRAGCWHPNGIRQLDVALDLNNGAKDDRFALDSSRRPLPPTLRVTVQADGGGDEIDVRGASQQDAVLCGGGFDRAFLDWGDAVDTACELKVFDGTLDGQLASGGGPAVASWSEGRLDVFYRGTSNELRHKWWDGSAWRDESLGGVITSDPAAVSWGPGRIDVFARGADDALWQAWYDGRTHHWESLKRQLSSAPAASSWGSRRLDVFGRAPDGRLAQSTVLQ
jgi:hypothetical protein